MINVQSMKKIKLYYTDSRQTVKFAAEELLKYIGRISGNVILVEAGSQACYDPTIPDVIWVGLCQDFNIVPSQKISDPLLDDYIHIDITRMNGIIAGINPRSVLAGIYRFLTEAGCRWLRPGRDGEYIPKTNLSDFSVRVFESPAYRHRGICIEGAVSYENIADMIDFIPKIGMNAYFLQFREAYIFFERWYSHKNSTSKTPEVFSVIDARAYMKKAEDEIKKRSLIYHAVGHGWTCEPLGIPGLGWDSCEYDIPSSISKYLAEVGGKRELWGGVPLNTNLCYSNPEVQELMINDVIKYLKANRNIDILHFWLADEKNNQCECTACKKLRPSDYFVQILNKLDERLSNECIDTKIAFLIYLDLLWAPEFETIHNTRRFIMMFAPITRTYSTVFDSNDTVAELMPYKRNELEFSSSVSVNHAFLKEWQKIFKGDSFDFDYHLWWDIYNDPGHCKIPELLSLDIKNLKKTGLNGYISCQVQRAFFPTGLGMYVLGKTLWNNTLDTNEIIDDYFASSFGIDGYLCKDYLSQLSILFDPQYFRGEKPSQSLENAENFRKIPALVKQFRPIIKQNLHHPDMCRKKSWEYLRYHSNICYELSRVMREKACGNHKRSFAIWENFINIVSKNEDRIQGVFDVFEFIQEMRKKLNR
jgi:hypothetical protein